MREQLEQITTDSLAVTSVLQLEQQNFSSNVVKSTETNLQIYSLWTGKNSIPDATSIDSYLSHSVIVVMSSSGSFWA